ncbi:MAG: flagellar basal body-associated FliL family protein [Pseudomonadota bacterium]
MSEDAETEEQKAKKPSKLPLILGVVLALLGGGGGFYAVWSGVLFGQDTQTTAAPAADKGPEAVPDIAFVDVDQIVISLSPPAHNQHLIFRAKLEVPSQYAADVALLLPRVVDVLNGYLRALELGDLESPAALTRLRAQMLRRVQVVTGQGRVKDLLIMEFVLN